jgi:ectoine hydroxylase-related dioxygenase (phytanoyl-CoA dioxygenase family)
MSARSASEVLASWAEVRELGLERFVAELEVLGYTVVPPGVMGAGRLAEMLLARIVEVSTARSGGVAPDFATGDTHRDLPPEGQQLHFLLAEGEVFERALMHPVTLALVTHLLGHDAVLSSCTAWLKGPGWRPIKVHADQKVQPTPFPLTCNATYALTDYSRENGGICFVPGSHRHMRQPTAAEDFRIRGGATRRELQQVLAEGGWPDVADPPDAVAIEAPRGSLILWQGNTWHGAFGRTAPGLRVALIYYFCAPQLHAHEGYREHLPDAVLDRNDDRFARLVGRYVPFGWTAEGPSPVPRRLAPR